MPYFAAVAAVRIQSWLARTPDLRYARGASVALTSATASAELTQSIELPGDVVFDPDTADVAGVCVLRGAAAEELDQAVDRLLDHLQQKLPGVEWVAWRTQAPSYVVAYDTVHGRRPDSSQVRHWPRRLPLTVDLPFAIPCAHCSHEMAAEWVTAPGNQGTVKEGVGPDCAVRHASGANYQFRDFDELARCGGKGVTTGRRDAANHLATVCADGNRVGDFFVAVAKLNDPVVQADLSNAIDLAIHTATDEAAKCGPDPHREVAMKHFVGGDDVFASVAAPFAWQFVEVLGRRFQEEFNTQVAGVLEGLTSHRNGTGSTGRAQVEAVRKAAAEVSLGIGIAFAHASHPIDDCRETAREAERYAKRATRGKVGAASWIDITVEPSAGQGGCSVPEGRYVTIEQLTDDLRQPEPVLVMPSSARNRLVALLRLREGEVAADLAHAVRAWATRVGRIDELDTLLPRPDGGADVGALITRLRHTVDRARWWPRPVDEAMIDPAEEEQ